MQEKHLTLSTWLTVMRIILTPFIVRAMIFQLWGVAFILFLIAAITDFVDGFLARLWHEQTALGALLDPIADKILILAAFFTLAFVQSPLFEIPLWFVSIVLLKEIVLIGGTLWYLYKKGIFFIQPVMLGKIAMFVQTGFILWLFTCYFFSWFPIKTYYTMLIVVVCIVFATLAQYIILGLSLVKKLKI